MFSWRVTKYDPKNRDYKGIYLTDEWTSYSDIGQTIDNKKLIYEEYLKTENAYVSSIILFMECNNLQALTIKKLEKHLPLGSNDKYLSEKIKNYFKSIKNGQELDRDGVDSISRLVLREKLWCQLESKDMFVHFGWDYYMYIVSSNKCEKFITQIQELGLFVEECQSPY